ncbi:MAG TPA: glycerol kinase GlpK [Flavilitoribacter sp.]|nr:glycerol kinase GlpK [Flavilitoribacter sp.]
MSNAQFVLAVDQGTSSTKTIVFDGTGRPAAKGSAPLHTDHFENGFVEQDPEGIFRNMLDSVRQCVEQFAQKGHQLSEIASCGISNQRETFILWDQQGRAVCPAVVWACKRSTGICEALKARGQEPVIRQKTGLILDPYFSGTKLLWLLQNDPGLKNRVQAGEIFFGTVDCWLLFKLTNGTRFRTDHTNASRTLLFNIHTLDWDPEILNMWGLENLRLPEVHPSSFEFGQSDFEGLFPQPVPITAVIGDSHAAAFGEGCYEPGTAKATLGTGCSIMMNTGDKPVDSANGMLTAICWSMKDRVDYALEGAIVACGSTLEWLRNELDLFDDPAHTDQMALAVKDNAGVYLIPAFSGLGAPHWQMNRKASIEGMTFGTTKNHIVRAALESIPYQIKDVIDAMQQDMQSPLKEIAVNGGIANNSFVIRFLADLLGVNLRKRENADVSALGAAYLSGLESGVFSGIGQLAGLNQAQTRTIQPDLDNHSVRDFYQGWQRILAGK